MIRPVLRRADLEGASLAGTLSQSLVCWRHHVRWTLWFDRRCRTPRSAIDCSATIGDPLPPSPAPVSSARCMIARRGIPSIVQQDNGDTAQEPESRFAGRALLFCTTPLPYPPSVPRCCPAAYAVCGKEAIRAKKYFASCVWFSLYHASRVAGRKTSSLFKIA